MKLLLFLTRGMSLKNWYESGVLSREMLLYRKLVELDNETEIGIFSYGKHDGDILNSLRQSDPIYKRIHIYSKPRIFSGRYGDFIFSICGPLIHRKSFKQYEIFKSNQTDGAWSALVAKIFCSGQFYFRSGYCWSKFKRLQKKSRISIYVSIFIELLLYCLSDKLSVSSIGDLRYFEKMFGKHKNYRVMPNYVDCDRFFNVKPILSRERSIVYVGRLSKQKNIFALIEACHESNVPLHIYGEGEDLRNLQVLSSQLSANCFFHGRVTHEELPAILNTYMFYSLVSDFEGSPKTLIEAMACGSVCIATDVIGSCEIINDKNCITALNTSKSEIKKAIQRALQLTNSDLSDISATAVQYIKQHHDIEAYVNNEQSFLSVPYVG